MAAEVDDRIVDQLLMVTIRNRLGFYVRCDLNDRIAMSSEWCRYCDGNRTPVRHRVRFLIERREKPVSRRCRIDARIRGWDRGDSETGHGRGRDSFDR